MVRWLRFVRLPAAIVLVATVVMVGCAQDLPIGSPDSRTATPSTPAPTSSPIPTPSPRPSAAEPTPVEPTGTPAPAQTTAPTLSLNKVVGGLKAPVDLAVRPDDPSALYVAEQAGKVRIVRDGSLAAGTVLDIRKLVRSGGEQGLLGLAFHPDPADGRLFVAYTARDEDQVVASFRRDPADPDRVLADSRTVLLKMADRYANHNGGGLAFGPDGYLYIATGDGGGAGDPLDSGRRLDTLLGKILRIDVDGTGANGRRYAIPPDNPFVDRSDARPEIWHTGLRNPWRIRFDRVTGDLWIGDVGQNKWEEIDRAPSGVGGLDFGWNRMEGKHCFKPARCDTSGLVLPVTEYGHGQGCSVTGGSVYRGQRQPGLAGWYVFADYCSGRMWVVSAAAVANRGGAPLDPTVALDSERSLSSIAEDGAGELYALDHAAGQILLIEAVTD